MSAATLDDAAGLQVADSRCVQSEQICKNFIGRIAQGGRRSSISRRRAAQAQRARDRGHDTAFFACHIDAKAAMNDLSFLEDLPVVVDGTARDAERLEESDPVPHRTGRHRASVLGHKFRPPDNASPDCQPARVGDQVGPLDRVAEHEPLSVGADRHDDLAVADREGLIRHQAGVGIAIAMRNPTIGEETRSPHFPRVRRYSPAMHVDVLAPTRRPRWRCRPSASPPPAGRPVRR